MVLGRPKTYAKKVVKKWSPPKGSRPKKKPKLSKIPPWGPLRSPQGGVLDSFGPTIVHVACERPCFERPSFEKAPPDSNQVFQNRVLNRLEIKQNGSERLFCLTVLSVFYAQGLASDRICEWVSGHL